MPRAQREKGEQAAIVELLKRLGAQVYVLGTRRPTGDHPGTCQTPGLPDLYAFVPSSTRDRFTQAVWIEVKAPGGRVSPAQQAFALQCWAVEHPYLCGGIDTVIAWCQQQGYLIDKR